MFIISTRISMKLLLTVVTFVCCIATGFGLQAAPVAGSNDKDVTVSILTAYPGRIFYELEGHTMLRIKSADYDVCVNWGVFDFNESDFVYRFVKGETDYMAAAFPTDLSLYEYRMSGRRVVEQILDLDSIQTGILLSEVRTNLLPENRKYRYNYLYDNCATRPLRFIEAAVGDSLIDSSEQSHATFRQLMSRYHKKYPWYQFGIDLALGSGIDKAITVRDEGFAPVRLKTLLDSARVRGHKLVKDEHVLLEGPEYGTTLPPTPWYLSPLTVASVLALAGLWVTSRAWRKHRIPRVFHSIYYGICFLAGCLLTFLVFVSSHEATSPNWLLLWLNPLAIIPAVCIWLKNCNKLLIYYHFANFVALLTLTLIALFNVQSLNAAFWPLILLDAVLSVQYIATAKWTRKRLS